LERVELIANGQLVVHAQRGDRPLQDEIVTIHFPKKPLELTPKPGGGSGGES
jgi:hypothetical protein